MILTNLNKLLPFLILGTMQPMVSQVELTDILPKTPQPHTFQQMGFQNSMNNLRSNTSYPSPLYSMSQKQRNNAIMAEVEMRRKQENEYRKRVQGLLNEAVNEFSSPYSLPSHSHKKGTAYYRKAFEKLRQMDESSYALKKAVFIVENAFYEEKQDYKEFENVIKQTGDFIKEKMVEFGYNPNSNIAKNLILFQFFTDTLQIKSKNLKHLPLSYDFEDYKGQKDWSKMFVIKLLNTSTGQCHSLPMLYLILAEEIGAIAHLAKSPNHTYIKFPDDENRKWYNVELTSHILTTNAHILQSGYIKAEAVQNKIYMHSLSKKQLFAQILTGLVMGYKQKFGNDEFMNQVAHQALRIYPTNITAHLNRANYYNELVFQVLNQLGITKDNINTELPKYPKALALVKAMIKSHKTIDALGYQQMPDEQYQKWLSGMRKEKGKQEQLQLQEELKKMKKSTTKL